MAVIGIFDSGSGGLSVLKELRKALPDESYIYYSDNANCPYGEKSVDFILERCRSISRLMLGKGAELIVVACNTATSAAIRSLREEFPVPFVGMEPAVKPAALCTATGVIGVLATAGTLKGSKYLYNRSRYEDDVKIVEHVGEGFVELVESGQTEGPEAEEICLRSLAPLIKAGADRIVLGCTHYPFLLPSLKAAASRLCPDRDIRFIDPAPAVARRVAEVMESEGIAHGSAGSLELLSSGPRATLEKMAADL